VKTRTHSNGLLAALLLLCFVGTMLYPEDAHARRRGVALINTGSEFFQVGALPTELASQLEGNWNLAYKCEHIGVFWADAWTWDCGLVAFDGQNTYADLPPEQVHELEARFPMSEAERGLWNRFGIVVLAGVAAIGGISRRMSA